jgi:pantoate--beta-alanine ligase
MYPPGFASFVRVSGLPDLLCGRVRPGHFDGVATVVAKLLSAAQADVAVFGEKDWQQLAIIRRMAADLDIGTEIHGCAIVRDADGLALSSRNAYLTADERSRALALPQALQATRQAILAGMPVAAALAAGERTIKAAGFVRLDYLDLVDGETLHSLGRPAAGARLMGAGVIGTTRLIDNIAL